MSTAAVWIADFFAYLDDLDLALRTQLARLSAAGMCRTRSPITSAARRWETRFILASIEYITRNQIYLLIKDYPQAVFRRLLPRIVIYQCLWAMFAIRKGGFGAYLRGMRTGSSASRHHASRSMTN